MVWITLITIKEEKKMLNMMKIETKAGQALLEALQNAEERVFYRMSREDDPVKKARHKEADKRLRAAIMKLSHALN